MRFPRLSALLLLAMSAAHAQTVDGWTIAVRTTIDSGSLNSKHWFESRMRIAGHFTRTETLSSLARGAPASALGEVIVDDSANTTTLLYAPLRRASVIAKAIPSVTQVTGVADPTSRFIVAPTITMRDLGPGEPILGHPTHKYSFAESYVAQTMFMGAPCKRTSTTVETIWTATDMPREEQLRRYVRDMPPKFGVSFGPVADSLNKLRLHRERLVNGQILRTTNAITKTRADGTKLTITTSTDVTELSHGPLARSVFTIPRDFTVTPVPTRAAKAFTDSALAARKTRIDSIARTAFCDL